MLIRRFCWISLLWLFPSSLLAQTAVQACPSDAFNQTFQAITGPGNLYTLIRSLRNISAETCFLSTYPSGGGVSPTRAPNGSWLRYCYQHCGESEEKPIERRINVPPGGSVDLTLSWKTASDDPAHCVTPTEIGWPAYIEWDSLFRLSSPSLLKPICSPIVTTDYVLGQVSLGTTRAAHLEKRTPKIEWRDEKTVFDSPEHVPLGVTVQDPSHVLLRDQDSCPRIFVQVREANPNVPVVSRRTRVDEMQNATCKKDAHTASGKGFLIEFDPGYILGDKNKENQGEYTIDVSALAEVNGYYFLTGRATPLHLSLVAGRLVRRNWNVSSEGLAVSLMLDKDSYPMGADIPLHIALENVSSKFLVGGSHPIDAPAVEIQLFDSAGRSIRGQGYGPWIGHGWCLDYLPGVVVPIDETLKRVGYVLTQPGTYHVVASWTPSKNSCTGGLVIQSGPVEAYSTVTSPPVTFEVTARSQSQEATPPPILRP